jgi:putative PIN family toxin of toxin-antitoxin system
MLVVADTNTVISGLLWQGAPRQILDAARYNIIELFTSVALLTEMEEVLHREKFARRLSLANLTPHELVLGYASLATVVKPAVIMPVVLADPDDDAVLSCAVAACAEVIVSGDSHLLNLKGYQGIHILTAGEVVKMISK